MKALRNQGRPLQVFFLIHFVIPIFLRFPPYPSFLLDVGTQKCKCSSCTFWCFCGKLYYTPGSVFWHIFTWVEELGPSVHQLRLTILRWVNHLLFTCVNKNIFVLPSTWSGWTPSKCFNAFEKMWSVFVPSSYFLSAKCSGSTEDMGQKCVNINQEGSYFCVRRTWQKLLEKIFSSESPRPVFQT